MESAATSPGRSDERRADSHVLERRWALLAASAQGLLHDRIVWLAGAVFVLAPFRWLLRSDEVRASLVDNLAEIGMLAVPLLAIMAGLSSLPRPERSFWRLWAGGLCAWASAFVLYLLIPRAAWSRWDDVAVDCLFLVFYVSLLLAIEQRPDERPGAETEPNRFRVPAAVVFCIGLFCYFVLIPALVVPEAHEDGRLSFGLYLAMDGYLTVRLFTLSRRTRSLRWGALYAALGVACASFAISDLVEWLYLRNQLNFSESAVADLFWSIPTLLPVLAIRLRHHWPSDGEELEVPEPEAASPFLPFALTVPLLHIVAYRIGLLPLDTRPTHDSFVVAWLVVLGAVSLIQHVQLQRRHSHLVDSQRNFEHRLWLMSNYDSVTGLPNRHLFEDRLTHALKRAKRDARMVALVFIDLDDFKRVNDSYGPSAGDELLAAIAERLKGCVRESDTVGRLGGDEFTLVLEALEDAAHADFLVQMVALSLREPFSIEDQEVVIGASVGVSLFPRDGNDAATLLRNADAAMYEGKRGKLLRRSNVRYFAEEVHGQVRDRLRLENELRYGIDRGEFVLYYQPQWTACGSRLVGVEALIRWEHPRRGLLPPGEFIDLAERTGLIDRLGTWILEDACRQLAAWHRRGFSDLRMAVNLSAAQLNDSDLIEVVFGVLRANRLPAQSLELEVTETMIMADLDSTSKITRALRLGGVTIAIDDFGTGNSSLQYLSRFAPHTIKIDREFIQRLDDPDSAAIVAALIRMAQGLEIQVVAEGVERESERAFLEENGCDLVQGYLLGMPQPAEKLSELLTATRSDEVAAFRRRRS